MKKETPITDQQAHTLPGGTIEYCEANLAREMERAIRTILAEPEGCRFCDHSIRRNPQKDCDDECGYKMARLSICEYGPETVVFNGSNESSSATPPSKP